MQFFINATYTCHCPSFIRLFWIIKCVSPSHGIYKHHVKCVYFKWCVCLKIVSSLNPNLTEFDKDSNQRPTTILHVAATGPVDMIHFVWDFSHKPTVFLFRTPVNASVLIDWKKQRRKAGNYIHFTSTPSYSAALVINRVIIFVHFVFKLKIKLVNSTTTKTCLCPSYTFH